jgi:chromosomal replication initiator protein
MSNKELWQSVLAQIQFSVSRANFATWFCNTKILSVDEGKVLIAVENSFSKEWLSSKYTSLILKTFRDLDKKIKSVEFIIRPTGDIAVKNEIKKKKQKRDIDNDAQLPFQEFTLDKKTNLNPRYSFDNFIVGSFNELAHAAALAIVESPGLIYNPLFIYGGVGLGKTHLIQATANKIAETFPEKVIQYTPAERFISGIVDAIRNHNIGELKNKLNKTDVLIIDDVQFFTGKEKSQEEFFHIFNTLYQSQKQIILSSDRSPKAIPAIAERLRSRFGGGMIADIGAPDLETRIAILKAKSEEKNVGLDQNILEYIASNVKNNIRELEGALNRLIIFYKINSKSPDIKTVKKLLNNLVNAPKKTTNFKNIVKTVSNFYDLTEEDLLSHTRKKEVVRPRQIAMYLLREELNESYPSIGRKFKGKDHTTIIYAFDKIQSEIKNNETMLTEINLIRQRLYSEF